MRKQLGSHGLVCAILLSTVGSILLSSLGIAGPNRGAVLLVHTEDTLDYSLGQDFAGSSGLECPDDYECPPYDDDIGCYSNICAANPTSHRGSDLTVWWVLAAVPTDDPANHCPRIKALTFGINLDESALQIVDWGTTAPVEFQTDHWPGPQEGTSLVFSDTRLAPIVEVYWFAGYAYYETVFSLRSHPTQGGLVADDAVPANLDPIEFYGRLGFNGAAGTSYQCGFTSPVVSTSWGALKAEFH